MNVILSNDTVFRIQKIINKPISRGFDKEIQNILNNYEKLQTLQKNLQHESTKPNQRDGDST